MYAVPSHSLARSPRTDPIGPTTTTADPFAELRPPLGDVAAVRAAERCLECGGPYAPAPCTTACPAAIDVPAFVGAVARGEPARAAAAIFAANLLGGSCARVCPVEVLCEGACVLTKAGFRPVEIARLQRHATDWALTRGVRSRTLAARTGRTVAVIGGGPAGLACAGELAALGHAVTLYEARPEPGGLVRYAIAPYRQRNEPLPAEVRQIVELGVRLELRQAIDTPQRLREIEQAADAVFLGVGMGRDVALDVPGVQLLGVWSALAFVESLKTGALDRLRGRVIVVGGGNTAIDVAREALRLGAAEATVVYRRTEADMPAHRHEVLEARDEGVRFQWLASPVRLLGADRLEGVECRYNRITRQDGDGRRVVEPVPGTEFVLPADVVITAVGQCLRPELLEWIPGLGVDRGRIRVDPVTGRTGNPKYFAGGDATNGGGTAVEAVRAGKLAARAIDRALREEA